MSTANIKGFIEQGKRAVNQGNKAEAQAFLMRAVELDESNEEAWLWLASAVEGEEDQRTCLTNVLVINPNNTAALQLLEEIKRKTESASKNAFTSGSNTFDTFMQDATGAVNTNPFGSAPTGAAKPDPFGGAFTSPLIDSSPFSSAPPAPTFTPSPPPNTMPPVAPKPAPPKISSESSLFEAEPKYRSTAPAPAEEEDIYFGDFLEKPKIASAGTFQDGSGLDDNDFDDDGEEDFLGMLPATIKPTRIPGTDEPSPRGLVVGLVVVGILNLVALIGLVVQFVL
ncbi:MAG: tetratricopeptide repeat protein [Phototrophicaceae bacterium]|jgi:hypothetical protein